MNTITGIITKIDRRHPFNWVEVASGDARFRVLTMELKETFRENGRVAILFKECDVLLVKNRCGMVSAENVIPCEVTDLTKGEMLSEITMHTAAGAVRALISRAAHDRMKLERGDRINACINASEISLMEDAGEKEG